MLKRHGIPERRGIGKDILHPATLARGARVLGSGLLILTLSATITLTTQKNRRPPGSPSAHYHAAMKTRRKASPT